MKVPNAVHAAHPWVMGRIAPDFDLLDVWALPVHGDAAGFDPFLAAMAATDPTRATSAAGRISHALFWVRRRLGAMFGWDDPAAARPIPGSDETSLRARLPEHLVASTDDLPDARRIARGFSPVFRTGDEIALEVSNATVHGALQLTWVPLADGGFGARLAVYVKPRGPGGRLYLKAIEPFRRWIVYPALTAEVGRAWRARTTGS